MRNIPVAGFPASKVNDALKILGFLPRSSPSESEIRKSFRKLAVEFHPDKVLDADDPAAVTANFQRINEAQGVLLAALAHPAAPSPTPNSRPGPGPRGLSPRGPSFSPWVRSAAPVWLDGNFEADEGPRIGRHEVTGEGPHGTFTAQIFREKKQTSLGLHVAPSTGFDCDDKTLPTPPLDSSCWENALVVHETEPNSAVDKYNRSANSWFQILLGDAILSVNGNVGATRADLLLAIMNAEGLVEIRVRRGFRRRCSTWV